MRTSLKNKLPEVAEEDWDDLLFHLENKKVIPVVGPGLVTVPDGDGGRMPLVQWIAPRLAEHLKIENADRFSSLNDVVSKFLVSGGDRGRVCKGLRALLKEVRLDVPPALMLLAEISDFELFISSTFDSLLTEALGVKRPGFARSRDVLEYNTKPPYEEFPNPLPPTIVFHILGKLDTWPDFAVWEDDYMEYLCCLTGQSKEDGLKGLFEQLRTKHLLFLGAPCNDWIVRFFVRTARGSRLTEKRQEDLRETIADHHVNLGEPTVVFFNQIANSTRVVDGDPSIFVEELARRWRSRQQSSRLALDFLGRLSEVMPRGSVFISYSHDDEDAATLFAMTLAAANIPVWFDKERLHTGQNLDLRLEQAVREDCSYFVSLISASTEANPARYVHIERKWAASRHREGLVFYLPVCIDETASPKLEPACFANTIRETALGGKPNEKFIQFMRFLIEEWNAGRRPRAS